MNTRSVTIQHVPVDQLQDMIARATKADLPVIYLPIGASVPEGEIALEDVVSELLLPSHE